jgi:hypothetical protein
MACQVTSFHAKPIQPTKDRTAQTFSYPERLLSSGIGCRAACEYTGRFIMFSVITNISNKKTKGPALKELLTATGKLKKVFF